jgi:hypothetical protein
MLLARHLQIAIKLAVSMACVGMAVLWPEWRATVQAQDYSSCRGIVCPETPCVCDTVDGKTYCGCQLIIIQPPDDPPTSGLPTVVQPSPVQSPPSTPEELPPPTPEEAPPPEPVAPRCDEQFPVELSQAVTYTVNRLSEPWWRTIFDSSFRETTGRTVTDEHYQRALDVLASTRALPTDPRPGDKGPAFAKTYPPPDLAIEIYEDRWVEFPEQRMGTLVHEFTHALAFLVGGTEDTDDFAQDDEIMRRVRHKYEDPGAQCR